MRSVVPFLRAINAKEKSEVSYEEVSKVPYLESSHYICIRGVWFVGVVLPLLHRF